MGTSLAPTLALSAQHQYTQDDPNGPRKPFHGIVNNLSLAQRGQQQSAPPQLSHPPFLPYQPPPQPKTAAQLDAAKRLGASLPYLVARSDSGDATASYLAGRAYEVGIGTPNERPDLQKAVHFYTLASKHGILNGRYHAGYLMTRGFFDEPVAQPPHDRVQALYIKAQGDSLMSNAIVGGYNLRSEEIQKARTQESSPAQASSSDAGKAILAVGALAVAAAVLAGGENSSTGKTDGTDQVQPYQPPKFCMVPDTVRSADGTVLWEGRRAGSGYECP